MPLNLLSYYVPLLKEGSIWELKHGQIVMITKEPYRIIGSTQLWVEVLRQDTNVMYPEYVETFCEATKIG